MAPGARLPVTDLFHHHREATLSRIAPLADRMRPRTLEEFAGQEAILGPGRLLRRAIAADRVGNLILHGPPGTGKTTLARIIANTTRAHFASLNAVLAGVKELRAEVEAALQRLERHGLRTILFLDEVHRFNSAQQDALLPWVENGTVTLIGATTENPCFEVNKALVSRSRLFRLQPLEAEDLRQLLQRALRDRDRGYGAREVAVTPEAEDHLLQVAGGDARSLLNALELAVETTAAGPDGRLVIDLAIAEESIQQRAVLYDKQGDAHYDTISAFIKSIRGSDPDAALFWLAQMVEAGENPRFLFRRLLIAAGEDIGLADPQAMVVVQACAAAFEQVGLPEGLYPLAQATLYLANTEKSNSTLGFFDAVRAVRETARQRVPGPLRDASRDGSAFGDGVGYRYPHAFRDHWVAQQYLPDALQGEVFWQPGSLGWEGQGRQRLQQRRAAQLAAAAESTLDPSDGLSSSPEDPVLERWLRRQAVAEGERLDRLRARFWRDAAIGRLERVLVLEARSLLWALDPLQAASEGEVVLSLADDTLRERLEGQLQVLDQLRRPRLLAVPPERPEQLGAQLEAAHRFEWFAGRQPFRGLAPDRREAWLQQLTALAAPRARARLLFSRPLLGPAGSLEAWLERQGPRADREALGAARLPEAAALAEEAAWVEQVRQGLERRGWRVRAESWSEELELPLGEARLQRWLGAGADYRRRLEAQLDTAALAALAELFRRHRGARLPHPLGHTLLRAEWEADRPPGDRPPGGRAPGGGSPGESPRRRRHQKAPAGAGAGEEAAMGAAAGETHR
jgi:putative ATPase